jgi:excinuclease ABC subunit A
LGYITWATKRHSGGEAQHKTLENYLKDTGNTFYILDEPTTGLHFEDIRVIDGSD